MFLVAIVYSLLYLLIFPVYETLDWPIYIMCCLAFIMFFFLLSYCSDPGYLKKPKNVNFGDLMDQFDPVSLCPDCQVIRTKRSRHCAICNRCVERFDHHCPWINNCVGGRNHKWFLLYLISIVGTLLTVISCLIINIDKIHFPLKPGQKVNGLISVLPKDWYNDDVFFGANVLVLVICFFFLLPVLGLSVVQLGNFVKNKTTSERFARQRP